MTDSTPRAVLLFEDFRLDLGRARLLGPTDAELALRPKAFDVLRHLVENAGRLVPRDELMQAVWPDVFVTDDSITQCVAEVRRALGDGVQRLLRTVPRRGYLFAAEVTRAEAPASPTATTPRDAVIISPPPAPEREEPRSPAPGVPTRLSAERRQLTLLFCDLADSTALAARLDPEDLQPVIHGFHRVVTAALEAQGGHVAKFLGDGVLAYFGWPQAHEDDAERAVRAGLAAAAAMTRLDAPGAGPLAARVGIATGPVVVGEVLGEGEARERGVVGETPNLAARLQDAGAAGTVVADATTRGLTGALFEWADLGEVALKGFPRPTRAWRALGPSGVESRFEALRGAAAHLPLIGREEELDLLLRRWRRARAGEGQVVLLRGEAGIGKSRLTAALRDAMAGNEREELVLYGSPQHTDSALRPVGAGLERAARLAPSDPPEVRLAKLEALLLPLGPPPEDVALVADLLSVDTLGRWPVPDLAPQARRMRLLRALVRRVRALAARRPALVVVEDAHWIDPTTRELLDLLVAEAPGAALLLVVTHRPEFDAGAWIGQPHVTPLQLNRLGRTDHRELLRRVAGGKALPAAVEAAVLARTDGVPLFIEEVSRTVLESGVLREEADRWVLDGALPQFAVPDSLQASLLARLDRLPGVREVAQAGAVIGREFAHDLLAALADLPEDALRAALDALASADLVHRRGEPPDAVYAFRHALIRDAAYGTLLRERRRALHARTVLVLEQRFPGTREREPELLAQHCSRAGLVEQAVVYRHVAGRQAIARSAMAEAVALLRAGLDELRSLPEGPERRRKERDLQLDLAAALTAARGYGAVETGEALARAGDLCRGENEPYRLFPVLNGQMLFHSQQGEPDAAHAIAAEMLERADAHGDAALLVPAHRAMSLASWHLGRFAAMREHAERALALYDADRHGDLARVYGLDERCVALGYLGIALLVLGYPEQARQRGEELIARARGLGSPGGVAHALQLLCILHFHARDMAAARTTAEELVALAAERGLPYFLGIGRIVRAWVLYSQGGDGRVLADIEEAGASLLACGTRMYSHAKSVVAEAHARAGHLEEALRWTAEACVSIEQAATFWLTAERPRRHGALLLLGPVPEAAEAEACFRRAIRVARDQGARWWELRAARDLARLWRGQGRVAEARDLLAPVYASFTEGFGFPDLVEARALLEELGAAPEDDAGRVRSAAPPSADPQVSGGPSGPSPAAP